MADQFDEQSTRYNATQANEGTSVYDSCDDEISRDIIKKFTTEININILGPYEFIHSIKEAIWISHIIEDIYNVLFRLDGVSCVIYRSEALKELSDGRKIKPSVFFGTSI